MDRHRSTDTHDEHHSPTSLTSFTLLEARDSHADDTGVDSAAATAAAATTTMQARASSAFTPEPQRHPFQFLGTQQTQSQQQQQPLRRTATVPTTSVALMRQPAPESVYEYSGRVGVPSPAAQSHHSFQQSHHSQQQRDPLLALFPLMHSSVFTTPANIMPSLQDGIVIDDSDDVHPHNAQMYNALNGSTLNASTLAAANQLSLTTLFGTRTGAASASVRAPSARAASCQSFLELSTGDGVDIDDDARSSSTSQGDSLSDPLRSTSLSRRRTLYKTLQRSLRSLVQRFHTSWDSYFLLFTLALSLVSVPLAVGVAAVLANRTTATSLPYVAACQLPRATGASAFAVSTASLAAITIPTLNHAVLFVVSLSIAIRCSRARTRVLRSHATQSARANLTSAFMLPCYEAIWYTIAVLSLTGVLVYTLSYKPVGMIQSTSSFPEPQFPCEVTTMPLAWILQLLPMLMAQRSVSQEAVVRSIVYSAAACIVVLVLYMSLYRQGPTTITAVAIGTHVLLCAFYFWAKFVFHARATFDFVFISAVVGIAASVVVQIVAVAGLSGTSTVFIGECIVHSLFALTTVALLLSLRADTRYWLGIDDASGSATATSRNPMRQYMRQLSERGMITNFSTRTSVYDVHRMIEEHRKNVVDFSALKLNGIIAQGATSIVMRGVLRSTTDIALKIYTTVHVTDEELHRFSRETALNVQLSHPNVVRFYGLCVVPPSISLVFEFCEFGGLDVALASSATLWGLSTKLKAWLDACKAVAYLHSFSPPLLHRDIKTDNFLLGQDYLVKLADFGEANLLRPRTDGTMTIAGTVDYMAPEMILGGKTARYGTAVDTYSLMITLWQIMVPDRSPWDGKTHLEVYTCVQDGERPPLVPSIPRGCAAILESGWAPNPVDRVAVADLIPKVHKLWLSSLHQKMLKRTK